MITGPKISTTMFYYDKPFNEFSQEASSLGGIGFHNGFVLVSRKTQVEVSFKLASVERSVEGELQCWNFKAEGAGNAAGGARVVIFND